MPSCHHCKAIFAEEFTLKSISNVNVNLGVRNAWYYSNSAGYAWIYCQSCFDKIINRSEEQASHNSQVQHLEQVIQQHRQANDRLQSLNQRLQISNAEFQEKVLRAAIQQKSHNQAKLKFQQQTKKLENQIDDKSQQIIQLQNLNQRLKNQISQIQERLNKALYPSDMGKKRRQMLQVMNIFDDLSVVISKIPPSSFEIIKQKTTPLETLEKQFISELERQAHRVSQSYQQAIAQVGKQIREKRMKEVRRLDQVAKISKDRLLASNLLTPAEVEESLRIIQQRSRQKTQQIKQWQTIQMTVRSKEESRITDASNSY